MANKRVIDLNKHYYTSAFRLVIHRRIEKRRFEKCWVVSTHGWVKYGRVEKQPSIFRE